jgi:glycosyltransferase involved in cell wall biosynthesis
VETGLRENIHFLGNRKDVYEILPQLDLVVSASLWEGFPTILLEAMSRLIPIVATDIPGTRELIIHQKTGTLVPPNDPQRLADAIAVCLKNPEQTKAMARSAREQAAKFTIQNTVKCHSEIYRGVIG